MIVRSHSTAPLFRFSCHFSTHAIEGGASAGVESLAFHSRAQYHLALVTTRKAEALSLSGEGERERERARALRSPASPFPLRILNDHQPYSFYAPFFICGDLFIPRAKKGNSFFSMGKPFKPYLSSSLYSTFGIIVSYLIFFFFFLFSTVLFPFSAS